MTLISKETAAQLTAESRDGGYANRISKPDIYLMALDTIETGIKESKGISNGRPIVKLTFKPVEVKAESLKDELILSGTEDWAKYHKKRLADLFVHTGSEMPEVRDLDHLKVLLTKMVQGKNFAMAVKIKESVWVNKSGKPILIKSPEPWYFGPANTMAEMKDRFDAAAAYQHLDEASKQQLHNGTAKPATTAAPTMSLGDDLPGDEPIGTTAAKAAATDDLDDLP